VGSSIYFAIRVIASSLFAGVVPAASPPADIPVRDAGAALDSLGVVTHLDYRGTPYEQIDRVSAALRDMGIRHVRDMTPDANVRPYETLARAGVRFDFVIRGGRIDNLDSAIHRLEDFQHRFPGSVASIEGLNEANLWPATFRGLEKYPATIAVQRELHDRVRQSTVLGDVPVYAPTLGGAGPAAFAQLGDLSDYADMGNAHVYFDTRPPRSTWTFATGLARLATPRREGMVVTETGYASAGQRGKAVDETVQAKYLLALVAESWRRGPSSTFLYQLVDDRDDRSNWSYNLGLYRFDWQAKPAAHALQRLLGKVRAAMHDQDGVACSSHVTLPAEVSALWLKVSHGCVLLLWRDLALWNAATDAPLSTTALRLLLDPAPATARTTLFDAFEGSERVVAAVAGELPIELGDRPLMLLWHQ
jgi:hypothetical protein